MNYKQYSRPIWDSIESSTHRATEGKDAPIAAFDADGTLWDTDLGENFFHFLIDRKLVPLPPDPWNHYLEMKKVNGDPRAAYVWLAQILAGYPLTQVREWAEQALQALQPFAIFPEQKKLVDLLRMHGVRVYIVTASVKWAVEPGARRLGLTEDDVLGVETAVENGLVTARGLEPITYREGKAQALLAKTGGRKPYLCSGNSTGDVQLLECATDVRLAVSAASRDDRIFKTEDELLKLARARGWFAHRFIQSEE